MIRISDVQKRILSFVLFFVMFFNSTAVIASDLIGENQLDLRLDEAETFELSEPFKKDGFIYEDKSMTAIVGYEGRGKDIIIPDGVGKIGSGAFKNKGIRSLVLNEDLRVIEDEAFSNNSISGSIVLTANIEFIGERAFADNLITSVDLSELSDPMIDSYVFQDNMIRSVIGLDVLDIIPDGLFLNNLLKNIDLSENLEVIRREAFAYNLLSEVEIKSKSAKVEPEAFASNGRYVVLKTDSDEISSDISEINSFGHLVNPVNIFVNFLDQKTGRVLKTSKKIEFDPYSDDYFVLNEESKYKPDIISGYMLAENQLKGNYITFIPNEEDFELNVYYKEQSGPKISINSENYEKLIKATKEGDNITEDELLSLVSASDATGNDLFESIKVYPQEIINAEARGYSVKYSVIDSYGNVDELSLILPIAIDPLKIKIDGTDWVFGDFTYDEGVVTGFSKSAINKAKVSRTLAIPNINPYTLDPITVIDLKEDSVKESVRESLNSRLDSPKLVIPNGDIIEQITDGSFESFNISGSLPNLPALIEIGDRSFYDTKISGKLPEMPKLVNIGSGAFSKTKLTGLAKEYPSLISIGEGAFEETKDISGSFPNMLKLEKIGSNAFFNSGVSGIIQDLPNLEVVGAKAFAESGIIGLPKDFPSLRIMGDNAFENLSIEGELPKMPVIEEIGESPFAGNNMTGTIEEANYLKILGYNAFDGVDLTGELPDFPELVYLGASVFNNKNVSGSFPDMPKLEYIGGSAFGKTKLSGPLKYMPNLRVINGHAFIESDISGVFPEAPKLEYIGVNAFAMSKLEAFPDVFPSLNHVGATIIRGRPGQKPGDYRINPNFTGHMPQMPKLEYIGRDAFNFANCAGPKGPLYIESRTLRIDPSGFRYKRNMREDDKVIIYGKMSVGGERISDYHEINPTSIKLIGKNSKGEILLDRVPAFSNEDGNNLIVKIPEVPGYISDTITISKNDLVNNVYTHIYKSIPEHIDDNGGNKYQFKHKPISKEGVYRIGTNVKTELSLSTINESILSSGRIEIEYDEDKFTDFKIDKSRGIRNIVYRSNGVSVLLDEDTSVGYEISVPVSFKIAGADRRENLFKVSATLYNDSTPVAYGDVHYGGIYNDPNYNIGFTKGGNKKIDHRNIIINSPNEEYMASSVIYHSLSNFDKKIIDATVNVDPISYKNKDGETKYAILAANSDWKQNDNGSFVWKGTMPNGEFNVPSLTVLYDNPARTEHAIGIRSSLNLQYEEDGRKSTTRLYDSAQQFIYPELREGSIIAKRIRVPHDDGRHSYFHDTPEERKTEFRWELQYNPVYDMKELVLKDYDLDNRMKFTAVDTNERRARVFFYDSNGKVLLDKSISERFDIPDSISDKVRSIDFKYYDIETGDNSIRPYVYSVLRNPEKDHYIKTDNDDVNRFYNKMKTYATLTNGDEREGYDFAYTNLIPENKSLSTEVKIISPSENLLSEKTMTSKFSLQSRGYIKKNVDKLKYTALVEPGHSIEKVVFPKNVLGSYDISTTRNGWTKIDLTFTDLNFEVKPNKTVELFSLITTNNSRRVNNLKVHGLLAEDLSKEGAYELYNKGRDVIEGIDSKKYSYDKASVTAALAEYFTVKKEVSKNNYTGSSITTNPGEKFSYIFQIDNFTKTDRTNFELIDILPFKGDLNNSAYRNELDLTKDIKVPAGFKIEYLNQADDINVDESKIIESLRNANWSARPNSSTKAIRVTASRLPAKGDIVEIEIPMITNKDLTVKDSFKFTNNRFAYTHDELGYSQALSNVVSQMSMIQHDPVDIKLTKVSHLMGREDGVIEGVEFALKDSRGSLVATKKTDSNGEIVFEDIIPGNYTVSEISSLEGYKEKARDINITMNDMINAGSVLNLGKVVNDRIDKFNYVLRNVEYLNNLDELDYPSLSNSYSRELVDGKFIITNIDTGKSIDLTIIDLYGESIELSPGRYRISQTEAPEGNGLTYIKNNTNYMFEIDKFGKLHLGKGKGDSLSNTTEAGTSIIYFPNTVDYKTSTVNIRKVDESDKPLGGAEFTLTNVLTGEKLVKTSNNYGDIVFADVLPGMYRLEETKAPNGYLFAQNTEMINVPINKSETFNLKFVNHKIKVNIHKYKVIADMIIDRQQAEEIASKVESSTGGRIVVKKVGSSYQVREVWEDNNIVVNGKTFKTDSNGSVIGIENSMSLNEDTILNINNSTKIPNHYEPNQIEDAIKDYTSNSRFNGTIDINIEVKPLKGTVYVSKYVIDENDKSKIKEGSLTNGAVYDLMVNRGKGFVKLDSKKIDNSNYVVFKDLDPNYEYRVVEASVPEGQEESEVKEIDINLSKYNNYTVTTIFRNYIPKEAGEITIKKVDGDTNIPLEGVEFKLMDRNGISKIATTKEDGLLVFEDVEYSEAPYKLIETKTKDGYRLPKEAITITESDIESDDVIVVKNYKMIETPDTGTLGRLPFIGLGFGLIIVAFVFKRKELI